jgi:hypothetical protein
MRERRNMYDRVHERWGGVRGSVGKRVSQRLPREAGERWLADDADRAAHANGAREQLGQDHVCLLRRPFSDNHARAGATAHRRRARRGLQPLRPRLERRLFARHCRRPARTSAVRLRKLLRNRGRARLRGRIERPQPRHLRGERQSRSRRSRAPRGKPLRNVGRAREPRGDPSRRGGSTAGRDGWRRDGGGAGAHSHAGTRDLPRWVACPLRGAR